MSGIDLGIGPQAARAAGREPHGTDVRSANDDEERLREAARAFESLLVQMLVREMRDAQLEHGFFGDTPGSSVYESLFEQHLAERLAEDSPFGVAEMLFEQWSGRPEGPAEAERLIREIRQGQARESYGTAQVPVGPTDPMSGSED